MLIRDFYFKCLKDYAEHEYLTDIVLRSLIIDIESIKDMSSFYLHLDDEIKNLDGLQKATQRVLNGEPYQYIIQKASFRGHDYFVDERVLIPRLETEELVSCIMQSLKGKKGLIVADVGTGSGCLALEIKKAFPDFRVLANDISTSALEVAHINKEHMHVAVELFQGDMLFPYIEQGIKLDVIISNPPYIANEKEVDRSVLEYEPHLALFAPHGIDYYEEILQNVHSVLRVEGMIFFEFNYDQRQKLHDLIAKYLPQSTCEFYRDAFAKWRYVKIIYHA